jgi:enamine deaminase RidA (YjgF/YER057c/UK114 family)
LAADAVQLRHQVREHVVSRRLVSRDPGAGANVPGDLTAQTKRALENGVAVLDAAGMSPRDVVAARVYLAESASFDEMRAVYRKFFLTSPPASSTVRSGFPSSQYLIEISLIASTSAPRQVVSANTAGGTIHLSGVEAAARTNGRDTEAFTRPGHLLRAGGSGWPNVSDMIIYLLDLKSWPTVYDAYRHVTRNEPPPASVIQSSLIDPNALVDVTITAHSATERAQRPNAPNVNRR